MTDRRLGLVILAIGLLAIGVAQHAAPAMTPPLYDGVVTIEPFRWLVPAAGQRGEPKSANSTAALENGASPLLAIATGEQPPQAQIFATSGAMVLPVGTTSIKLSIEAILPRSLPADGHIAGNVYRISVTNQAGVALTAPADKQVTVVIRGPENTHQATLERLTDTGWQALKTEDAGFASTFLSVVTGFGDFALVAPGAGEPYPTATPVGGSAAPGSTGASPAASDGNSGTPGASVAASPVPGEGGSRSGGPPLFLVLAVIVAVAGSGAAITAYLRRRRERQAAERNRRERKPRSQARPRRR